MNFKMIRYVQGWLLLFEAGFLLVPCLTALCFKEWSVLLWFLLTAAICAAIGHLLKWKKPENTVLYAREGFVIVSLSWILLSLFGALPMTLCGAIPSYIDALFEASSGFTTTGASILSEVESLPKAVIMWRSFMHWVGGMGVLVFIMAFLPLSGGQNMHIMKAESPGPSVSKLVPRVRTTALILYVIYFALTILQFAALLIAKMPVFNALNTAIATAGTGGFGFKNDSFASMPWAQQTIVTVFMILFAINFACYWLLLTGNIRKAFNSELITFLSLVFGASLVIATAERIGGTFSGFAESFHHSIFSVATVMSTTGFATADFNLWSNLSKTILVSLMFVGGMAGGTAGGTKMSRVMILFKGIRREMRKQLHPRHVKNVTLDGAPVPAETVRSVFAYYATFAIVYVVSLLLLSIEGQDLTTNFTAIAATINNVGPGLAKVGPTGNYGFFGNFSKLVLIFDMIAGRLEIFPMLLLFSPMTWKK